MTCYYSSTILLVVAAYNTTVPKPARFVLADLNTPVHVWSEKPWVGGGVRNCDIYCWQFTEEVVLDSGDRERHVGPSARDISS